MGCNMESELVHPHGPASYSWRGQQKFILIWAHVCDSVLLLISNISKLLLFGATLLTLDRMWMYYALILASGGSQNYIRVSLLHRIFRPRHSFDTPKYKLVSGVRLYFHCGHSCLYESAQWLVCAAATSLLLIGWVMQWPFNFRIWILIT